MSRFKYTFFAAVASLLGFSFVGLMGAYLPSSIPTYPNFAALRGIPGGAYPEVRIAGHATIGDGGQATYYWKATSNCNFDGGYCVAPSVGSAGPGRWILEPTYPLNPALWNYAPTAAPQFYVNATGGSDTNVDVPNYCLEIGHPCATVQHAFNVCTQFTVNASSGIAQKVNIYAGTYNESVYSNALQISQPGTAGVVNANCLLNAYTGTVTITGDGVNPCTICATSAGSVIGLMGNPGTLLLTGTRVTGQAVLYAQLCGGISVTSGVILGAAGTTGFDGGQEILEDDCSQIQHWNSFTVQGNANCFASFGEGGQVKTNGTITVTFSGQTYGLGVFCTSANGLVKISGGTTFAGTVVGPKFVLAGGGRIYSQQSPGAGIPIPGTASSSILNGNANAYPEGTVTGVSPSVGSCTGLGSTGSCGWQFGDSRSGIFQLTAGGTGIGSSGTGTLTLAVKPEVALNNSPLPVMTTAGCPIGTTVGVGTVTGNVVTFWWSSPSPLPAGNCFINYSVLN